MTEGGSGPQETLKRMYAEVLSKLREEHARRGRALSERELRVQAAGVFRTMKGNALASLYEHTDEQLREAVMKEEFERLASLGEPVDPHELTLIVVARYVELLRERGGRRPRGEA